MTPSWADYTPEELKARFAMAMRPVDRVVVISQVLNEEMDGFGSAVFDYQDREEVQKLIDLFEPEEWSGDICLCIGDVALEFYSGDEFVFRLTEHHGRFFRADMIPWVVDARMSPEAGERFLAWFGEHGLSFFDDLEAGREAGAQELKVRNEALVQDLPPVVAAALGKAWDDPYYTGPSDDDVEPLVDSFGSEEALIKAVWRTYGRFEDKARYYNNSRTQKLLGACLKTTGKKARRRVLAELPSSSEELLLNGAAFQFLVARYDQSWWAHIDGLTLVALIKHVEARDRAPPLNGLPDAAYSLVEFQSLMLAWLREIGPQPATPGPPQEEPPPCGSLVREGYVEAEFMPLLTSFYTDVVLRLAESDYMPLVDYIQSALPDAPQGEDRMALEVAWAWLDESKIDLIGVGHLGCGWGRIEETAFKILENHGRLDLSPVELLQVAKGAGYSSVRHWAEEKLNALGLAPYRSEENKGAENKQCLEKLYALLEAGDYEVVKDMFWPDDHVRPVDMHKGMILAELGVGYVEQACRSASSAVGYSARGDKHTKSGFSELLQMRAQSYWAVGGLWGDVKQDFRACRRLDDSDRVMIWQHLAYVLSGAPQESGIADWLPFMFGDEELDPDFEEACLLYLQGTSSEEEFEVTVGGLREQRRWSTDDEILILFMKSVLARVAEDYASERELLQELLAYEKYALPEHVLSRLRLRELDWAETYRTPETGFYAQFFE